MNGREIILRECLEVAENNNYNGIFLLPTGSGKGRFMIEVARQTDPDTITYFCDNRNLRDEMFKNELEKWDAEYLIERTDFTCYQTAYKWKSHNTQLALYDEFDAALSPKYSNIFNSVKSPHHIYVSATLDEKKRNQAEKIAPIVYEKTFQDFVNRGILNKIQYYIVNYDLTERENQRYLDFNKQFSSLLNENNTHSNTHKRLNFLKIQRKQFLSSLTNGVRAARWIADSIASKNGKTLIFCGLSSQADKISPYSYHTNSTDTTTLDRFNKGDIEELAVVEKVTRGVNLNNVKWIIHESIGTSKTKFTQKTGRGMRLDPWDTLTVFLLLPYYRHPFHGRKPTIVEKWIKESTIDMDISRIQSINFKA